MGSAKNRGPIKCNKPDISWVEGQVFALGVWFATDRNVMLRSNYDGRIGKIKNVIEIWQFRRLTLLGKMTLIKSLLVSQLIYILTPLPTYTTAIQLQMVNKLLFGFLWDGKGDKIKREHIIRHYEQSGLKMIDIYIRSISRSNHPGSRSTLTRRLMEDGSFFFMTILKCMVGNLFSFVIYTKMTFHC